MLAQTTDSGGNNGPMAIELEQMFSTAKDPTAWDSASHHIRCYAHKLNLTVGHGLKALGQKVGQSKPSTPHGVPLPIPGLELNDGEDPLECDLESDEASKSGLPDEADGVDDEDEEDNLTQEAGVVVCDEDDVVAVALKKVSSFPSSTVFIFQLSTSILFIACLYSDKSLSIILAYRSIQSLARLLVAPHVGTTSRLGLFVWVTKAGCSSVLVRLVGIVIMTVGKSLAKLRRYVYFLVKS